MTRIFRLKFAGFQFYHHITTKIQIIEQQIDVEVIPAYIQMILVSKKCKPCTQFQQQAGHILYQRPFNVALHHIFPKRNEVKNIWVFHRLYGQFALWGRQTIFKVGYLTCKNLPLIKTALNLMDHHIARPAVPRRLLSVPEVHIHILYFVHQGNVVIPGDLCK